MYSGKARSSGITVLPSLDEVQADQKLDIDSLFLVVEHFDDVVLGPQSINLLKPDATVVIKTPQRGRCVTHAVWFREVFGIYLLEPSP